MSGARRRLEQKIAGCFLGSAIGDAMGGPVEGLHFKEIEARHGQVTTLLPYDKEPAAHAQWHNEPGSYTDDTRLSLILAKTLLDSQGDAVRGDFAKALADYYYEHEEPLARSFVEEYFLTGLFGARKLPFGGHPTNGAIMSNAVIGLLHPCQPKSAYKQAFELAFITDGYAKASASIHAAAVAAAMRPLATVDSLIGEALSTASWFRREGPLWAETVRTEAWARFEGRPNEELIAKAVGIAEGCADVFAVREPLYEELKVSPVGSEAGQTLAVAFAMLVAAKGDYRTTVIGAVNYGRDNDSYAAVAGALAGALGGLESLPQTWRETVLLANPDPDILAVASEITKLVSERYAEQRRDMEDLSELFTPQSGKRTR